jgi:uncharacterized membrane protein YhiD involved in acid resistance
MSLKSGGLMTKLLFIGSLALLFVWVVPKVANYYQNIKSYNSKKSELEESYRKYNIADKAEKFTVESFKKEAEAIFSDVNVKPESEHEYRVTIQVDKNKLQTINRFIESLSLHYLVKIKNNELTFEDKEPLIEVKFILEEL